MFTHTHLHSMFSLRDSIIKPIELVKRLKELGQTAVAITDHGNMFAGVSIYKALKNAGIKYIHGIEFYICEDTKIHEKTSRNYHLIALCKNEQGRLNLNRLVSKSELPENKYKKPRIDFNLLDEYGDGLVITSACIAGQISDSLLSGNIQQAEEIAIKYKQRFGEDFYIEIQAHQDKTQISLNKMLVELAHKLEIKLVVTCDAHYIYEKDRKYQNKYAFNGAYKEEDESYVDCYVQSEDEVRKKISYLAKEDIEEAINSTNEIAEKCNVELPLSAPIMSKITTPPEYKNNREWLEKLCEDGFKKKLHIETLPPDVAETYRKRYEYELDSLDRMGFIGYILLVYSYANVAKRRGIARGSGGGSLICYLTNITNIDPIEHGLLFERFVDVGSIGQLERGEITAKELKIPDIDLDFGNESCEQVLVWLQKTYGEDKVASIGKFGCSCTKGIIRDLAKVFGIELAEADRIAKAFGEYELEDLDTDILLNNEIPKAAEPAMKMVEQYPELFDYVRKLTGHPDEEKHLNGLPKSFGLHACGKVVAVDDLDYYAPSCYDKNGVRFLQGSEHDVEALGLVKIDLLGLRTVDQEYETLELSGESEEYISPKQDFTDEKVLDVFRNGDTLGVFQFASRGMRQVLKKLNPSGINDLCAANALFRPSTMAYIDNYCDRKAGKESFEYLHPDMEVITKDTYGIMVYQEQLIEIGRMAGMRNPDLLRRATAKKKVDLLEKIKPELHDKLILKGWNEEQFGILWKDAVKFGEYAFNRSHSAAYAIIAFLTAKQKAYYPNEFYAGLCNSYIGKSEFVKEEAEDIFDDMSRHNVTIAPFSFRNDHRKCSVKDGKILYAIPLLRDLNKEVAEILYRHKDFDGKYFWQLIKELLSDGIGEANLSILIKLGFFNELCSMRKATRIFEFYKLFKFGETKTMKKSNISDDLYPIVEKNSEGVNVKGEPLKSFKNINVDAIVCEIEDRVMEMNADEISLRVRIENQKNYIGAAPVPTGQEDERKILYVREVYPICRKSDGKQFGMSIISKSVGRGISSRMTVFMNVYNKDPINKGDLIYCDSHSKNGQYFTLTGYHHIYL